MFYMFQYFIVKYNFIKKTLTLIFIYPFQALVKMLFSVNQILDENEVKEDFLTVIAL